MLLIDQSPIRQDFKRWTVSDRFYPLKGIFVDSGDAVRDRDAREGGTPKKRPTPNARDAVRDRDAPEGGAAMKRVIPNARDAVRDRDAPEGGAATKRVLPNARDAVRDRDAPEGGAAPKRAIPNARDAVTDRHAREGGAATKRVIPNARDAVRDRDAPEGGAATKRFLSNARDAVRDRNAPEGGAALKRVIPNAGDAIGDFAGGYVFAFYPGDRLFIITQIQAQPFCFPRIVKFGQSHFDLLRSEPITCKSRFTTVKETPLPVQKRKFIFFPPFHNTVYQRLCFQYGHFRRLGKCFTIAGEAERVRGACILFQRQRSLIVGFDLQYSGCIAPHFCPVPILFCGFHFVKMELQLALICGFLRLDVSVKTGFQFGEGGLKIAFFVRVFALGHVRAGGGVKILCKGHGLVLICRRLVGVSRLNQLARVLPFRRVGHDPICRRNSLFQRFHFVVKTRGVLRSGSL